MAARFAADDLPEVLTLGDESTDESGFVNAPLVEDVAYRVFLRAVVKGGSGGSGRSGGSDGDQLVASSALSRPLDVHQLVAARPIVQPAELKQVRVCLCTFVYIRPYLFRRH